jgi:hypothetical protein
MTFSGFVSGFFSSVARFFGFLGRIPFALAVGVAGDYFAYDSSLFLLLYPKGSGIRPMIEAPYSVFVVAVTILLGVPLAVGEIRRSFRDRRRLDCVLGVLGLILSVASWPIRDLSWHYYQTQRNIWFED